MSARTALFVSLMLGAAATPAVAEVTAYPTSRPAHFCGTPQEPAAFLGDDVARVAPAATQRTVYLNKNGGTYQIASAPTNSATNTVNTLVSADRRPRTVVIPPVSSTFNWPFISECVIDYFARYNIRVTETEPTSGIYIEAVVGGNGTELGFPAGALLGIAAADNFCGVPEAGIAFSFSEPHRGIPGRDGELCATIAHEIGHLVALEHTTLAVDLMSYVPVSRAPSKSFADQFAACGTEPGQGMACVCTGGQTNSHQRLVSAIGTRPTETTPPQVGLVSPGDRATVPPAFEVVATASDNDAIADVTVEVDGTAYGSSDTATGGRYTIRVTNVPEGARTMEVIARDLAGNVASVQRPITVAKAQLGEACIDNSACAANLCAMTADGDAFCTQPCDTGSNACPSDFECQAAGTSNVCVPEPGGCGCTSSSPADGVPALLVFGLGLAWSRRRRQARRAA